MKIHYFNAEPWEETIVRNALKDHELTFYHDGLLQHPDLADNAEVLCVFIDSHIGGDELVRFPNLKLIVTRSTGFDHIDVTAAKTRGVTVTNVPSYGENTVAEFAFALLLALSRRVIDADEQVRKTGTFSQDNLRGFDLYGKTLGVVGCGHIGMHAIRMGNGFGMNVLGFDTHRDDAFAAEHHFTYGTLDELLEKSDVITLHVPYNQHTHHLINQENIGRMKKGAYLVNTARGAVVETEAIVKALKDGTLAGAALDVLEEEGELSEELALLTSPHPKEEELRIALENHYLIDHPRVIVTPHIAFNTTEAVERITATALENITRFAAGTPTNIVS